MTMIIDGTNGGFFPSWTTATRPASPAVGQMGYNTTTGAFDAYQSGGWATISTPGNIASASTAYVASTTSATTGSNTASVLTDWAGGSITLPAGTYLFSFTGVIEVQNISGGGVTVQGLVSSLIMTDTSNNYIWGSAGNYVHLNNTYNVETLSNSFIYTVSTTTSYKLRFGYAQNSGTPTTTNIYLRGNMGTNNSPTTLTAVKLY